VNGKFHAIHRSSRTSIFLFNIFIYVHFLYKQGAVYRNRVPCTRLRTVWSNYYNFSDFFHHANQHSDSWGCDAVIIRYQYQWFFLHLHYLPFICCKNRNYIADRKISLFKINVDKLSIFELLTKQNHFDYMKKISILGAGWLGSPLALQLKNNGHKVKVSTTTPEKISFFEENGIENFIINVGSGADISNMDKLLADTDLLIVTIPPG